MTSGRPLEIASNHAIRDTRKDSMLDPDAPLVEPRISPQNAFLLRPKLASGGPERLEEFMEAFHSLNTVEHPAFDDRGIPAFPPDEHILDDLCRRYDLVDEEVQAQSPPAGTAAVVVELGQCDHCRAFARYEVYSRGSTEAACDSCIRTHGDGLLGTGHSVFLVHLAEVPYNVRAVADELSGRQGRPGLWSADAGMLGWQAALRSAGFIGPMSDGSMFAWFFGTRVEASPQGASFTVKTFCPGERFFVLPSDPMVLPGDLDPLQIREAVLSEVKGTVSWAWGKRLESLLHPPIAVATARAIQTLDRGTYAQFPDWDELLERGARNISTRMDSCERTAAHVAASQSTDGSVIGRLALEHPEPEIRVAAVANAHCPDEVLLRVAERDTSGRVRHTLLERDTLPAGVIDALALSVLTNGPLNVQQATEIFLREDCPTRFEQALLDRAYQAEPQFRLGAAQRAHDAPPDRRDLLHARFLAGARRIPHTVELIDAVLGDEGLANHERISWLLEHPDRRVARIAQHYLGRQLPPDGRLTDVFDHSQRNDFEPSGGPADQG